MGKMKEKFLNDREEEIVQEAIDAFLDDDYQLEEYYASLKTDDSCGCNNDCPCTGESASQEEVQANHDSWWNSLTDKEKNHLYNEHKAAEDAYNEWIADADINQLKDQGLL